MIIACINNWTCVARRVAWFVLLLFVWAPSTANAQSELAVDSLKLSKLPDGHSPRRVLTRALLVPGWGQLYNRQYVRAGIYYAGLGFGGFLVYSSNQNYILYRHAALYAAYRDTPEDERPPQYQDSFVSDYEQILSDIGAEPESSLSEEDQATRRASLASNLRSQRNQFRRRRDLNILLTFGIWGLGVIESFVSAHLLHFDVSDDLTLQVVPTPGGTAALMTIRF